jgi:hypothetical protein
MCRLIHTGCLTVLVTATAAAQTQQPPCDVFCHSRAAQRAEAAGNLREFEAHVRAVAAIAPSHPGIVYQMARVFAKKGQPDSAIAWLRRLGTMGDTRDPNGDSAFTRLRARPGYADARNRLLSNRLPILDGKVAFEISDPDFIPEAIVYDSTRGRLLAGSLSHRVIAALVPDEPPVTFVSAPGMLRVVGIHIDHRRKRLWFATWAPDPTRASRTAEPPSQTRLFLADLETGRVVRSWTPNGGRPGHLLNDFVIVDDGTLYITDTEQGDIYRLRSPDDTLEMFIATDHSRFTVANGITSTPDGRTLYVAFLEGIARVDVATRSITQMPAPDSVSTASIDGLYWFRGSLVAVQGLPTLQRVVRYELSAEGTQVVSGAVLERGPRVVEQPTTGVFVGSKFYYIANSQYGRLDDRGGPLGRQTGKPVLTAIRVIDLR